MERPDAADRRHDRVSERHDVIRAIEPAVAANLSLLLPLDRAWQPTDYLPDLETAGWRDEVDRFRTAAEAVSDELLVVLVGDMVTEEALPSYSVALNGLVKDDEGTKAAPWARWLRGCVAGPPRRTATAISSTPTSASPAACTCAPWNGPSTVWSPTASIRRVKPIPTTS